MELATFRLIFLLKLCIELIRLKNGIYAAHTSSKPLTEPTEPTFIVGSQSSTIPVEYLSNPVFKSRANRALGDNDKFFPQMEYSVSDYNQLIKDGGIFIDKTMLIKYLLESESKVNLITAPRKWGKTTNLKMIEYFFEAPKSKDSFNLLPLNEKIASYQLFYNKTIVDTFEETRHLEHYLLISEEKEIMENHFGRHPVIHLDLMALELYNSYEGIMPAIGRRIQRVFQEHTYVKKLMKNKLKLADDENKKNIQKDLDTYSNFIAGLVNDSEYTESIGLLCQYLNEYTTLKKPIILIDEHDAPFLHVFTSEKWNQEDQEMLITWFSSFLSNTFKKECERIEFAILTGCIRIVEKKLYSRIHNFKHYNFLNAQDIFFFYGFHQREVEEIMKMNDVPKEEYHKVRQFYDGYKGGYKYSLTIYNPFSIANYISERKLKTYWTNMGTVAEPLKLILFHDKGQEHLMNLITGGTIQIEHALEITDNDLKLMREILKKQHINYNKDKFSYEMNLMFKMMFSAGYLTVAPGNVIREYESCESVLVKIPNEEIKLHLASYLYDENVLRLFYTNSRDSFFREHYIDFIESLTNFLLTNTTDSSYVSYKCKNLLKQAPLFVVGKQTLKLYLFKNAFALYGNEAMPRIAFDYTIIFELMLNKRLVTVAGVERTFSFLGKQYRIDLVIIHEDMENKLHGTIIKYKFMPMKLKKTEQNNEHALSQCFNNTSYFLYKQLEVTTIKCVGISIQENKSVSIDSYFMDSTNYAIYLKELKTILKEFEDDERNHQRNVIKKVKSKEELEADFANTILIYNVKYSKLLKSTFHLEESISIAPV